LKLIGASSLTEECLQLFFTDTGAGTGIQQNVDGDDDDETDFAKGTAAWDDSDDERVLVSLANAPRLRKLRRTEAEDVVSGEEYTRRLRKQFQVLNPPPEWARYAVEQSSIKKRRHSTNDMSDEEGSEDEIDGDGDISSVAPLSDLLQGANSLVRSSEPSNGKRRKLRAEVIDIQRQSDLPNVQPSAITSLSVHPNLPLLLSSGPSSTLYLHHLTPSPPAPTPNPLLTSMHIRGSQLTTTAFHPTDSRIFLSARRRYFHIWDLATGKVDKITRTYGHQHEQRSMERFKLSPDGRFLALLGSSRKGGGVINILDATTLQWTSQVRIESRGGIAEFAWWRDSTGLCIAGKNGEVTEWSATDREVVARWQDEGAVGTTTIALGGQHDLVKSRFGTDRWIAIGSSSGIINIYDRRVWLSPTPTTTTSTSHKQKSQQHQHQQPIPENPKPTRTLDHLTTPTSHLVFSPDAQILAVASKWKRDAMRLVHLPSCTVFKNWPTGATPLGRISSVAFMSGEALDKSHKGGGNGGDVHSVLAVANEQGKIRLWEIR
jgi:U3 small nucleolar RNA-associated protein 18